MKSLIRWLLRWQEKTIVLPILLALGLSAWIVLSALDRTAGTDVLSEWVRLPLLCAKITVALAFTGLIRRRWRFKMDDLQQQIYWRGVIQSERGPLIVYLTDTVFTLVCAALLLHYCFSA